MFNKFSLRGKRGLWQEPIVWWIIAIVVLILVLIFYTVLSGKIEGAIDYFRNIWRFRR